MAERFEYAVMASELVRLTEGIRAFAHSPSTLMLRAADQDWRDLMRSALDHAEIETTDAQFERAWRTLWRRAFMGGTYTLDAKAILAAIHDELTQENRS